MPQVNLGHFNLEYIIKMKISNENIRGLYALLIGFPFSCILSYLIFKPTSLIDLFIEIADFGIQGSSLFWGIIYPVIYLIILFTTGRNISPLANTTLFQKASIFSFSATLKVIAILIFLF